MKMIEPAKTLTCYSNDDLSWCDSHSAHWDWQSTTGCTKMNTPDPIGLLSEVIASPAG